MITTVVQRRPLAGCAPAYAAAHAHALAWLFGTSVPNDPTAAFAAVKRTAHPVASTASSPPA